MKLPLKIQNIFSSDLECNSVKKYRPTDLEDVFFQTYFEVLNIDTDQFYEFQAVICTPQGLARISKGYNLNLISDRCLLVYSAYDYDHFIADLNRILDDCNVGENFDIVVLRLQRYFIWEYEGEVDIKSVVLE